MEKCRDCKCDAELARLTAIASELHAYIGDINSTVPESLRHGLLAVSMKRTQEALVIAIERAAKAEADLEKAVNALHSVSNAAKSHARRLDRPEFIAKLS